VYRGVLHVYADAPNISPMPATAAGANAGSSPVQDIVLTLSVPDCVKITVSGEPMNFGSVRPGSTGPSLNTSLNTPRVIIETNQPRLQVQVVMDALRLEGAATTHIAGNQTALAWGKTPAEALQKAQMTTIGSNQFIYPLDKAGIYTFYLAGRVAVSMTDAPGSYKGRATITANVQ
jgi:hypothetical protein